MQLCTHVDLNNIAKIVKKYTCKDIFKKNATKAVKATSISKIFGAISSFGDIKNFYHIKFKISCNERSK